MAGNDKYTIEVDGAMLPALLDALRLASSVALASEVTRGKPVRAEFRKLRHSLVGALGLDHDKLDAYRWYDACRALEGARAYHWLASARWGDDLPIVTLVVDGRGYAVFGHERLHPEGPVVAAADVFLARYAHLEAERLPTVRTEKDYREWRRLEADDAVAAPPRP